MAYCLLYKLVLRVNFILGNNFFFALNSKEAVNFFSIKKILDARTLQSFRVLKIYGLGFKVSLAEEMIKLDLGWSHALFKKIPGTISLLKKQDKILVYGFLKHQVFNFAEILISLYSRSAYQIKGLFDIHEKIKKKVGKQRQK